MIQSMTGYGRAEGVLKGQALLVEIRSVNHRHSSVVARLPRALSAFEETVKKKVQSRFERGRMDLSVILELPQETKKEYALNLEAAESYYESLKKLKKTLGLSGEIDIALMSQFRDVITEKEKEEPSESLEPFLNKILSKAMNAIEKMRKAEGKALVTDLIGRLDYLSQQLSIVKGKEKQVILVRQKRLKSRVAELSSSVDVDHARIAQEVAIFAERADISEERTRLKVHIDQFKKMLRKGGVVGRSLDFLLQEMFREVNTLSAKSGDQDISMAVVAMKSELEKMREQVQNIA